jgi:hypothetical protein
MPVVPAELGVGALERRVTVRLRLLDTAGPSCQFRSRATRDRGECVPVPVVLLRLVVLRRVL